MFSRPIHIGLSPNISADDYWLAVKSLFTPWSWKRGKSIEKVENWFKDHFEVHLAISFNAGRSALLAILESLNLEKNSEVLVEAYTCVAVPNSVVWAGLKPIYVDIDETLNLDIADAERKLTSRTKALIVQHTFGIPSDMDKLVAFAKKHNLLLIEDCAHALGGTYKNKLLGTFGEAAFFSFGRDKIVSSVFGGMAITNNKNLGTKIVQYREGLAYPSYLWILRQLLHVLISGWALALYQMAGAGKLILYLSQKLKLVSMPVYFKEILGRQPADFPKAYPNVLASLALWQLDKLPAMNECRRQIAKYYFENIKPSKVKLPVKVSGAVYLRYNLLTNRADEIRWQAKKQGMILGNWYHHTIDPKGVIWAKVGYPEGSCPRAEAVAATSLNLATYPSLTKTQMQQIVSLFKG